MAADAYEAVLKVNKLCDESLLMWFTVASFGSDSVQLIGCLSVSHS